MCNRDKCRSSGNRPTLSLCGIKGVTFYGLGSRDVKTLVVP